MLGTMCSTEWWGKIVCGGKWWCAPKWSTEQWGKLDYGGKLCWAPLGQDSVVAEKWGGHLFAPRSGGVRPKYSERLCWVPLCSEKLCRVHFFSTEHLGKDQLWWEVVLGTFCSTEQWG